MYKDHEKMMFFIKCVWFWMPKVSKIFSFLTPDICVVFTRQLEHKQQLVMLLASTKHLCFHCVLHPVSLSAFHSHRTTGWSTVNILFRFCLFYTFSLFILLRSEASIGVGHFDGQLLSTLNDSLALATRHAVSNLSREAAVLHQQHF